MSGTPGSRAQNLSTGWNGTLSRRMDNVGSVAHDSWDLAVFFVSGMRPT
jgi:hypothetical protein